MNFQNIELYLLAIIIAYLLGAFSPGVIAGIILGKDPFAEGSGSSGTTNIWRLFGPVIGTIVFLTDVTKAYAASIVAYSILGLPKDVSLLLGFVAIAGHTFSFVVRIASNGRRWGGKGVAAALGVALAYSFWVGLAAFAIWLLVVALTRTVSTASMIAVTAGCGYFCCVMADSILAKAIFFLVPPLVIYLHAANIERIKKDEEPQLDAQKAFINFLTWLRLKRILS